MKEESPNYRKTSLKDTWDNLSKENQTVIEEFLKYCGGTSNHIKTHNKIKVRIILFADVLEKDISQIDLNDLTDFLRVLKLSYQSPETKQDIIKQVKRFLKWKYYDYPQRFKEFTDLKNFQLNNVKTERLSIDDLLTEQEFEEILKSTSNLKTKTMLTLLMASACRPEEIINLKINKLNLKKGIVEVYSRKTRAWRIIPIKKAIPQLKRYINESFINPIDDMFLFPTDRNNFESLTPSFLNYELSMIQNKLGYKKVLFPYLFRHTVLNMWLKVLSVDIYEKVAGHSIAVALKTYSHLDTDKIVEAFSQKIYEVEELTPDEKKELNVLRNDVTDLKEKLNKMWELMQQDMMNKNEVKNEEEAYKPLIEGIQSMANSKRELN